MVDQREEAILERLATIHSAPKAFDSWPEWEVFEDAKSPRLTYRVALKLNGTLGGGVYLRLTTPQLVWDEDVYGHVEVTQPNGKSHWRLDPVEWKPRSPHVNNNDAPSHLRLMTLTDRVHPFSLNRRLGLRVFAQAIVGIAQPFPRAISTFDDYCALCAELWNCPDMRDVPPPKWSKQLV